MSKHLEQVYALGMNTCSSCGMALGHLYDDHVELTKKLIRANEKDEVHSTTFFGKISQKNYTESVREFYKWKKKNEHDKNHIASIMQFSAIVARALLKFDEKPWKEEDLPCRREADGQRSAFEPSICCLRHFQCKPDFKYRVESS